ncbi:MAG: tetratricopeptide repeat protein [Acidobacteriota bacterium]
MGFFLLNLLFVWLPLGYAQTTQPVSPPSKSWAVVIGVSKYPKLPGGYQIQFADKDALAFAEAMRKICGDNVRTFINQEATVSSIKEAVGNWLARSTTENDTVYIFFSGHGFYEKEYGESYFLTFDSDANVPYSSAVSLKDFAYAIGKRVRARRVLLIADAMRQDYFDSEKYGDASKNFVQAIDQVTESRSGISSLLANKGGEFSREGQRWEGHGVFTRYVLEAINKASDKNRDGVLNGDELFDFIASRISQDTSNKQHPTRLGNGFSEIAWAKVAGSPEKSVSSNPVNAVTKPDKPVIVAKAEEPQIPKLETAKVETKAPENKPSPAAPQINSTTNQQSPQPPINRPSVIEAPQVQAPKPKQQPVNKPQTTTPPVNQPAQIAKSNPPVSPTTKVEPPKSVATNSPTSSAQPNKAPAQPTISEPKVITKPEPVKVPKPAIITSETPSAVKTSPNAPSVIATSKETAAPPSPMLFEFEEAIKTARLLEPKGNCAWDYYQQLSTQANASADVYKLKLRLTEALIKGGKEIIGSYSTTDSVSDRVDDIRRAGQMFSKARALSPETNEALLLEKLSAAQALLALQFYDEAERALMQLPKSAFVENAFGLVYAGRLDYWKAERAYQNAIAQDANWFAPHYNLGLLFRAQKKEEALGAFEQAAKVESKNAAIFLALGDEYFSQSKWQQAAENYRKAVNLKPYDDTLHTKLGHALYSQGLRDEANREYQKAKELRSKQ